MVQPVASSSCFSCTASYSACELIYDVVQRVSTCVRSIFSAIATFVTSWCSWAETPPAPVAAPIAPPTAVIPLAIDLRDQEMRGANHFLQARMDSFRNTFPAFDFGTKMRHPEKGRIFLARLMIWDIAKDAATIPLPFPPFIADTIDLGQIENLRRTFNTLSEADYHLLRYDFVQGIPASSPTRPYSDAARADAFMQQADEILEDFLYENELFEEIADSFRLSFLRNG